MAVKFTSSAHKSVMEDPFPGTERFYLNFRQKVYPALADHDLAFTLHTSGDNHSGSHYLSDGNGYYMLDMPTKFVMSVELCPNFAYNVAANQNICGWYYDADSYWVFRYNATDDKFEIAWYDGTAERVLQSRQFDDGTSHEDIDQWMRWDIVFDSTTGDTSGSILYFNRNSEDAIWSGNVDARGTRLSFFEIRALNGTEGDYKINFVRFFSGIITDDVANDHKDIEEEEIYWCLNDYEAGQTRCNITRFVSRFSTRKNIDGANTLDLSLLSKGGEFADEQYSAFVPASDSFNGLTTQRYLQHRVPVIAEHWHDHDFETFFVGRVNDDYFQRTSQQGNLSMVNVTAEDMVSDIAREVKRKAWSYTDYDLCKPTGEATSLLHTIVRLATKKDIYNFLANSSFENATIGNSWLKSGGTFTRDADLLIGTYCGKLDADAASAETVIQTVTFTGTKKLNVGEKWNFSVCLKSAGAATANIELHEYDSVGSNDNTTKAYDLSGSEGWVKTEVMHTITDTDSDRLRVIVNVADGEVIYMDAAMLVQNDVAYDWFVLNNNDGASAVESADDADSASYDTSGFDTDAAAITHPYAVIEEGKPVWRYIRDLKEAALARYAGVDSSGTFVFKPRIDEPADPSSLITITAVKGLYSQLQLQQANKIIIHGIKIVKHSFNTLIWSAEQSGMFGSGEKPAISLANGEQWPDPDIYGELWAVYDKDAGRPEGAK